VLGECARSPRGRPAPMRGDGCSPPAAARAAASRRSRAAVRRAASCLCRPRPQRHRSRLLHTEATVR
jgi:hypothetical protein